MDLEDLLPPREVLLGRSYHRKVAKEILEIYNQTSARNLSNGQSPVAALADVDAVIVVSSACEYLAACKAIKLRVQLIRHNDRVVPIPVCHLWRSKEHDKYSVVVGSAVKDFCTRFVQKSKLDPDLVAKIVRASLGDSRIKKVEDDVRTLWKSLLDDPVRFKRIQDRIRQMQVKDRERTRTHMYDRFRKMVDSGWDEADVTSLFREALIASVIES